MIPKQPVLEQERQSSHQHYSKVENTRGNSIVIYELHQAYQRNLTPWYYTMLYQLSTDDFTEVINGLVRQVWGGHHVLLSSFNPYCRFIMDADDDEDASRLLSSFSFSTALAPRVSKYRWQELKESVISKSEDDVWGQLLTFMQLQCQQVQHLDSKFSKLQISKVDQCFFCELSSICSQSADCP